nr:MAG TPA: hypothetical protein [Caudoviricetes sp.]
MRNPFAGGFTGGSKRMWGDHVGNSLLTDEECKKLTSEFESGLFSFEQVRAVWSEAEIGRYLDAARYANYETFSQNCSGQKNAEVFNQLHCEMGKSNFNACDGCSKLTSLYANDTIVEQICEDHTCPIWIENHPKRKNRKVKVITVEELKKKSKKETEPENPCAGCKFRKYHDWLEPTWTGPSQHYYDCEKPGCPMWSRLWWRNNDDGTPLMDQQPIKLTRKLQHLVYEAVRLLNEIIEWLLN